MITHPPQKMTGLLILLASLSLLSSDDTLFTVVGERIAERILGKHSRGKQQKDHVQCELEKNHLSSLLSLSTDLNELGFFLSDPRKMKTEDNMIIQNGYISESCFIGDVLRRVS